MKLKQKLIKIGSSRAVVIPHGYLDYFESQGKVVREVILTVNDVITIEPIFQKVPGQEHPVNPFGVFSRTINATDFKGMLE